MGVYRDRVSVVVVAIWVALGCFHVGVVRGEEGQNSIFEVEVTSPKGSSLESAELSGVLMVNGSAGDGTFEEGGQRTLVVLRYGVPKSIVFDESKWESTEQLVEQLKDEFQDDDIEKLVNIIGEPLEEIGDIAKHFNSNLIRYKIATIPGATGVQGKRNVVPLVAYSENERFIWQAFTVGDEIGFDLDGRNVTVRTMAIKPRIFEIDNFIHEDECDHIIEKSRASKMFRSQVGDDADNSYMDNSRTSTQLWVGKSSQNDDEIFAQLRTRSVNLTKLMEHLAEDTQVVHYGPLQHYYAHHDFTRREFVLDNEYYQNGGNRLVTVLYYLNDVEEGGETGFPYVNSHATPTSGIKDYSKTCQYGLRLRPKKGKAAMFYSLKEKGHMDGVVDEWSLHSGCDVIKGEKWLANQWIRNKRVNGKLFSNTY